MRTQLCFLVLVTALLSGCLADDTTDDAPDDSAPDTAQSVNATFEAYVMPAVHTGHGLYEPTIDVADDGVIYVSAHSTGVGVVPAPGYYSADDGETWANLPFAGPASAPSESQGSSPPFSDEIFIVAGQDGTAWGVDINLRDYIVAGWCGSGTENCYYNPNAYDHGQTVAQAADCAPLPLKDRPWAAAANGTLLMVNNPGGGPVQVGAMTVPPIVPADAGPIASGIQWNLCASSGGFIPGIPDMRDDLWFAVPQQQGSGFIVVTGYATDVMDVQEVPVFNNSHTSAERSQIGHYGQAVFDADGTLWVGAMANTAATAGPDAGGIQVALSHDGATFNETRFSFDQAVSSIYLDGNPNGPGLLANWGQVDGERTDWYFGHIQVGPDGVPVLENIVKAVDDGPDASRHVQGAAAGPDGRAYMVMSEVSGNDDQQSVAAAGTTPMSVVVQLDGPVLPGADGAAP